MDDIDFAQSMKRSTSSSNSGRSVRRTDTSTVYGTAMSDSADGSVRVDLGGSIIGGDGMVGVTCPTTVTVRKGDTVLVQLVGARGTAQSPIVVGCVGRGDVQQGEINEAKEEADEAKTAAEQAKQSAKDAADAASDAQQSASDAADAAQNAIDEAGKATKAAGDAMDAATTAGTAASNAMSAATAAGTAATEANTAARGAVAGLGQVQDVLGTLDWIRKHGTYALTEDTTVDPSKVYYTRSGTAPDYTYAPVAEPKDEELATYYELSMDEALAEFVGAHLALLSDGLHVVSDASGYYIVLGNDAMRVYDPNGTLVAEYGETVQIGHSDNAHIEMDFNSFNMVDKEDKEFFSADDLRDEAGVAELTEQYQCDGKTNEFLTALMPIEIVSATDSSHAGASYTVEGVRVVKFANVPDNGATVTIVYKTNDRRAKAYTMGTRRAGKSIGPMSVAAGENVEASGYASHAEGTSAASGTIAHAEGTDTTASGDSAHAEGYSTAATGMGAHSEGFWTQASGNFSHAEGAQTIASGEESHAEGNGTVATDGMAHAEGMRTVASNVASHAEGYETKASGFAQHVEGQWNVEDASGQYAHIIGNGYSDDHRSNAHTVDWDGNAWYAGDVSGKSLQGKQWDWSTNNTTDTWVPVSSTKNGVQVWQHRAIPTNLATMPTTLFVGDTEGNITLSQSAANFARMTIFFSDHDGQVGSVEVQEPNGKLVLMQMSWQGRWNKIRSVKINGTSVNTVQATECDAATGTVRSANLINIRKVLGWKY